MGDSYYDTNMEKKSRSGGESFEVCVIAIL